MKINLFKAIGLCVALVATATSAPIFANCGDKDRGACGERRGCHEERGCKDRNRDCKDRNRDCKDRNRCCPERRCIDCRTPRCQVPFSESLTCDISVQAISALNAIASGLNNIFVAQAFADLTDPAAQLELQSLILAEVEGMEVAGSDTAALLARFNVNPALIAQIGTQVGVVIQAGIAYSTAVSTGQPAQVTSPLGAAFIQQGQALAALSASLSPNFTPLQVATLSSLLNKLTINQAQAVQAYNGVLAGFAPEEQFAQAVFHAQEAQDAMTEIGQLLANQLAADANVAACPADNVPR